MIASPGLPRSLQALRTKIARALQHAAAAQPVPSSVPSSTRALLESGAVQIKADDGTWIPFVPWPGQWAACDTLAARLCCWLKARQLGITWFALAHGLWTLLAKPGTTILLFSRRDQEAIELLERLKGMHARLPVGLRQQVSVNSAHNLTLGNGARALAFPCTAGDSYTAALAIVDEAALVPDLGKLLAAVKPTIDNGGQLLLLSRANKSEPDGLFARTYRAAAAKENAWCPLFLPWSAHPARTRDWYEQQKQDILSREGALDTLWEQYPETPEQALAPRQLDKRIPLDWLEQCFQARQGKPGPVPNARIFSEPIGERRYVIGGDPAEGNPTSDDSAACVLDADTGEQVAIIQGKVEPTILAHQVAKLAAWYHKAAVMPERNNHGHQFIAALKELGVRVLKGHDGKEGWLSTERGKVLLYDDCADTFREKEVLVRDLQTLHQLASIEGGSLRAANGKHDDLADAFALAVAARSKMPRTGVCIFGRRS
jgi:hypothetical protein